MKFWSPTPTSRFLATVDTRYLVEVIEVSYRLLTLAAVLCAGVAVASWSPIVAGSLFALAVSVAILAMVTARVSRTFARIAVVAAQIVGLVVNLPFFVLGLFCGILGLIGGSDVGGNFNTLLATVGFSSASIALITCLALLVSQRECFQAIVAAAALGNLVMLASAVIAITFPRVVLMVPIHEFRVILRPRIH